MLPLTIKDIRNALEKILRKQFDFVDFSIEPTKVMNRSEEFSIIFKIYEDEFWIDVSPNINKLYIGTRSLGEPGHIDSVHIWLSTPFEYDKKKFEFGWRKDLEIFIDALYEHLKEMAEKKVLEQCIDSVYGKEAETKTDEPPVAVIGESKIGECKIADKPSIFNGLKDDEDEYI